MRVIEKCGIRVCVLEDNPTSLRLEPINVMGRQKMERIERMSMTEDLKFERSPEGPFLNLCLDKPFSTIETDFIKLIEQVHIYK